MRNLGRFAADLNIRPWEIGLLKVDEFLALCAWLDEQDREEG